MLKSDKSNPSTADKTNSTTAQSENNDYNNKLEMTDEELEITVKNLKREHWQLELENECFEKFLKRMEPEMLQRFQALLDSVRNENKEYSISEECSSESSSEASFVQTRQSEVQSVNNDERMSSIRKSVVDFIKPLSNKLAILETGPRINISSKMVVVNKESDELLILLKKLLNQAETKKADLKAHIEEIEIRILDTRDSLAHFYKTVVIDGVDPVTKRITAKKFIDFMDEWIKNALAAKERFRLKTDTIIAKYNRVRTQYALKEELGNSLRGIEYEKLAIENAHLINTIEERNSHLYELKKVTGLTNLTLTVKKKTLFEALQHLKQIDKAIVDTIQLIDDMDDEQDLVYKQVAKDSDELDKLRDKSSVCTAPPVLDYVRKKAQLHELEEQFKFWTRKRNVIQSTLNANRR